jgi:chaperonin GroEL
MKEISFNQEAFDKMMVGFDKTANAVIGTLGPKGRNVFIDDPILPHITNDGHTIANSISFPDKYENAGAWVVKNTSAQTNDDAGDGTTTTAVLLKEIVHESFKRPESPVLIKQSLQDACKNVVEQIKAQSKTITVDDVYQVALVSSENEEIATMVSDMVKKLGSKGVITVEESRTFETSSEIMEGYEANVGFMSPDFADASGRATYENIAVLVSQKKISTVMDIKPLFDQLKESNVSQLVIVCDDIDPQILGILVLNTKIGQMKLLAIKATGFVLEDIASTVGATIISDSTGVTFDTLDINTHLGTAKKIICSEKKTLFIAETEEGKAHAERLKALADNNTNQYEKEAILKRVAKLTGGIGIIRIGASTDLERVYKKHKADDTVASVRSALEEGIVEGGGMALWRIAQKIEGKTVGEVILKKALSAPLKKIIENCGKDYTEIISKLPEGMGYDAKNDTYVNMIESGIIDPTKVERVSLENAVSNASVFITCHAVIVDAKLEK